MKLFELFESVSDVLFHATSFPSAEKMLESDTLKGNEGISFTRSLQGAYHKNNKLIGIIFQFDGRKLNQNYKGGPVGTENFLYDPDDYDPDDKDTWSHTGKDNGQLEDRVLSKTISPVTNYIVNAIVYMPKEYVENQNRDEFDDYYNEQVPAVEDVLRLLKQHRIPVRYVTSEQGLTNRKASDPEGFAKLLGYVRNEEEPGVEQAYEVEYAIYRGEGEWEPMFDYDTLNIKATSHEDALNTASERLKQNAAAFDVKPTDIDVIRATDEAGNEVEL